MKFAIFKSENLVLCEFNGLRKEKANFFKIQLQNFSIYFFLTMTVKTI